MQDKLLKLALLAFFLSFSLLYGNTYYIDANNGNDANSGLSPSQAWRTLTKLNNSWSIISPGDSILFQRGDTWAPSGMSRLINPPQTPGIHGTASAPIVIGAYGSGPKPVITRINSPNADVFYARNITYVTIQDIEFHGDVQFEGSLSFPNEIHHVRLIRITVDGTRTGGRIDFYAPAVEREAEQWEQSELHDIELGYSLMRNLSGSGIQLYGQGNNWIHNNEIYNVDRSGINFAEGDNNVVEYNIVSGAYGPGIKHSVHSHTANNAIIRGNLLLNNGQGGIAAYNLINARIYNNTIHSYGREAALFGWTSQTPVPISSLGTTGFDNNYIENNIFYGGPVYLWRAAGVDIRYKSGYLIDYTQNQLWEDNFWNSNIFYNPGQSSVINLRSFVEGSRVYYDPNAPGTYASFDVYVDNNVSSSTFVQHWSSNPNVTDVNANPQFVNDYWYSAEEFGDYSLQAGSPGRNFGVAVPDYTVDLYGNPTPQVNPDVGAVQSEGFVDNNPPQLENSDPLDINSIVLNFTEQLESTSAVNPDNFVISDGIMVNSATLLEGQTSVRVNTQPHDYGVNYTITVSGVTDIAGNEVSPAANSDTYLFENGVDETPPTLRDAVALEPTSVQLTFSEPVDIDEAQNPDNYTITGREGDFPDQYDPAKGSFEQGTDSWVAYGSNVLTTSAAYSHDGSRSLAIAYENHSGGAYVQLTEFADLIEGLVTGRYYTLVFWAAVNQGSAAMVVTGDEILPVREPIDETFSRHEITFRCEGSLTHVLRGSTLGPGQILYIDDIRINERGVSTETIPVLDADLSPDGTQVLLNTGEHNYNTVYTVTVNNLTDQGANGPLVDSNSVDYQLMSDDNLAPLMTDVQVENDNVLLVSFSEEMDSLTAENPGNYVISSDNGLSQNLFDADRGTYETGTESWTAYGNNIISRSPLNAAQGVNSLKIEYVNHPGGAYLYLSGAADLTTDLTPGTEYRVTFYAAINQGSAGIAFSDGEASPYVIPLVQTLKEYTIVFTASTPDGHFLRVSGLSSGEAVFIDNVRLRQTGTSFAELDVLSANLLSAERRVRLQTENHVENTTYTLTANNLIDEAGNPLDPDADSLDYMVSDISAPQLVNAELQNPQTLLLTFSDALDAFNAEDPQNYTIIGNVGSLMESGEGSFETGTGSWVAYGSNTISTSQDYTFDGNNSLKITYGNHSGGAYLYLNNDVSLTKDLVVDNPYKVTFQAAVTGGDAYVALSATNFPAILIPLNETLSRYEIVFIAESPTDHYLRLSGLSEGETVYIDDITINDNFPERTPVTVFSASLEDSNVVALSTSEHKANVTYKVVVNEVADNFGNAVQDGQNSKNYYWEPLGGGVIPKDNAEASIPDKYALYNNYPNPFNPATVISFDLPEQSKVNIKIYNILGEEVADLVNEVKAAGRYKYTFNASHLASGVYIYRIRTDAFTAVKKMILLK